jgi:sorting nexin-8
MAAPAPKESLRSSGRSPDVGRKDSGVSPRGRAVSESVPELLQLDAVTIEPVAQKKGLFVRHVEYSVKSEKFRSEVVRRYSDFQALQELLLARSSPY